MTIGAEEHEPLLNASENHNGLNTNGNNSPNAEQIENSVGLDFELGSRPVHNNVPRHPRGYGAIVPPAAPQSNLVYAWNDINVFAAEAVSSQRGRFLDCFRRNDKKRPAPQRKHILRSVSGEACPGELLAILGSSGAGKTTLLNALTFRSPRGVIVGGRRVLGGCPLNADHLTSLSAYVQQDELFIGTLTVREHLIFQSLVRMDRIVPYSQRVKRVNDVIAELGLTKCQNTVIGIPGRLKGLSGGEMKRLSFASEVLTDPPLMFCDEPTSGLDSFMAQNVVQVLKGLAQKGKTVVCTIHQPSSELYAMFDKLLLMAEGRVAFLGTPDQATDFFSELGVPCPVNYNPADFYIQLLAVVPSQEDKCRQTIETICDGFQKSDMGTRIELQAEINLHLKKKTLPWDIDETWTGSNRGRSPYRASWWAQMRAVLWRSWLSVIKEPLLIKVRMLQTVMVSLLIGVIYFGQQLNQDGIMNINGAIFIFLTNMTFQNVFAVISVFCSELPIFLREHRSGMYRTDVYFLCKTLADLPIFSIMPMLFTTIAYFMIGMNPEPSRFVIATLVTVLVANVAISFGYLISCASRSVSMALSIGPPLIIPYMLFGGFFLNTGSVPIYFEWLSWMSWFKYGNEALLINQWEGVESIACSRMNTTCQRSGDIVLQTLNFSPNNFRTDIVGLFVLIVGFRILAYLCLLSRTYRKE